MAGRVAYYGGIVKDGLVLDLDAAKKDSYPTTGTVWRDISGNSYTGSLTNGPTFSSLNGGSIVFDGVDDYVGSSVNINTGQNFTVGAWIYPTLLGTTRRAVVANSYNYSARNGWFFSTAGGNVNNTFFLSIGSDNAYRVAAANTLSTNQWSYIVATCTGGGSSIELFANGTVVSSYASGLLAANTMTYTQNQLNVGYRDTAGITDPYTGRISQTHIYTKVLSAAEVLQNYNASKGRYGL